MNKTQKDENIVVRGISKSYGKKKILSDICFEVNRGDIAVITGKNGCGKTTLLSVMAGASRMEHGEISYFGRISAQKKQSFQQLCSYVPQGNPLIEELTVKDNISLWYSGNISEDPVICDTGLDKILGSSVSKLSGGMKRLLSIVCALVCRPEVLILDEPAASLDIYYKEKIHGYLRKYAENGGTVILSSHDEQEIRECTKCFLLYPAEGSIDGNTCQLQEMTADMAIKIIKE